MSDSGDKFLSPARLQRSIKEGYLRYLDTAFWLRDEKLMAERRELFCEDGNIFRDALVEPLPAYSPEITIKDTCEDAGFDKSIANSLGSMIFNSDGEFSAVESSSTLVARHFDSTQSVPKKSHNN